MGGPEKEKVPPPGSHAKTPKYNFMYVWGSYIKIVPPGLVRGGVEPGEPARLGKAISEIRDLLPWVVWILWSWSGSLGVGGVVRSGSAVRGFACANILHNTKNTYKTPINAAPSGYIVQILDK